MALIQRCSCGVALRRGPSVCAACGLPRPIVRGVKLTGWLMLLVGAPLFAITLLLLSKLAPLYTDAKEAVVNGKFGGTYEQAIAMRPLLPTLALFGLSLAVYGLWRIIKGRSNLGLKLSVLSASALFLWFGYGAYLASGV